MIEKKRPSYINYSSAGLQKKPLGLYIHIPFCEKKCNYCDFASFDNIAPLQKAYVDALVSQFKSYENAMAHYTVDTVYIGGGSPSFLQKSLLRKLLKEIRRYFPLAKDAEITCEVNPSSAVKDKLKILKAGGVNRLSIGVQSLQPEELSALGRIHSAEDVYSTFENARKLKFSNVSADLIFSIPGQTKESFEKTLLHLLSLSPERTRIGRCMKRRASFWAQPALRAMRFPILQSRGRNPDII